MGAEMTGMQGNDCSGGIEAGKPNTEIEYLYRDTGNYKTWNSVIVQGTFTKEEILLILDCCEDGDYYFIPEQIGWPLIRDGELNDDDHCYCEFDSGEKSFVPTEEEPTIDMSTDEVVQLFKAAKDKWNPSRYDPFLGWGY